MAIVKIFTQHKKIIKKSRTIQEIEMTVKDIQENENRYEMCWLFS